MSLPYRTASSICFIFSIYGHRECIKGRHRLPFSTNCKDLRLFAQINHIIMIKLCLLSFTCCSRLIDNSTVSGTYLHYILVLYLKIWKIYSSLTINILYRLVKFYFKQICVYLEVM